MTEIPVPDDVTHAVGLIEAAAEWRFRLSTESTGGQEAWALRFDDFGDGRPSFAIHLTASPYTASAALVPDTFAGSVIRSIAAVAADFADEWQELVDDFGDSGTHIAVTINGAARQPKEASSPDWDHIEIEANSRIEKPVTSKTRGQAWASSTLGVLALFVACRDSDQDYDEPAGLPEGEARLQTSIRYERSSANRIRCLQHHGYDCWVCGFNFEKNYGGLGEGYIQVHHKFTVAAMPPGYRPDPKTEMVPLCPNCHAMVHQQQPPIDPEELKNRMTV